MEEERTARFRDGASSEARTGFHPEQALSSAVWRGSIAPQEENPTKYTILPPSGLGPVTTPNAISKQPLLAQRMEERG